MPAFKSSRAYRNFALSVTRSNPYVMVGEAQDFLDTLLREAQTHVESISLGSIFWRAQIGYEWTPLLKGEGGQHADEPFLCPLPIERMKPLRDRAREGRANPKGIPYLYVSTHRETALAEVRP